MRLFRFHGAAAVTASLVAFLPNLSRAFVPPASFSTSNDISLSSRMKLHASLNSDSFEQSRRNIFSSAAAFTLATIAGSQISNAEEGTKVKKVLVLGATGFVGSQVCAKLKSLGIEVVGTSRNGRDGTYKLDFADSSTLVTKAVEELSSGCQAVISCVGSIGTPNDGVVNGGSGLAALGAKSAGVQRFVYISVAPEVRESTQNLSFLKDYMAGKTSSENFIKQNFGGDGNTSYMLIEPTFIYGGDKFQVNPPRVADGYGKLVETVLSSGLFRAAASVSPGIIGIALEPPVSVNDVAGAAVAGALGYSVNVLDTYDKIREASSSLK